MGPDAVIVAAEALLAWKVCGRDTILYCWDCLLRISFLSRLVWVSSGHEASGAAGDFATGRQVLSQMNFSSYLSTYIGCLPSLSCSEPWASPWHFCLPVSSLDHNRRVHLDASGLLELVWIIHKISADPKAKYKCRVFI